jgi:hypothetical protein
MGKGLAKEFRDRDPQMFHRYKDICDNNQLSPGKLWLWRGSSNWTLNFPTKMHWRNPSKLEWVEAGLEKFVSTYEEQGIREISFPRLGCGNGNLDWEDVKPLMEHYLSKVKIPVFIHDYAKNIGIPEHLEKISEKVSSKIDGNVDFDNFLDGIRQMTVIADANFTEIYSQRAFKAWVDDCSALWVETDTTAWSFDTDDLHGAWVALLRGLVTRERIEWAGSGGGDCVLTLLSLLPNARAVEIQRNSYPEIAVELKPSVRQICAASIPREQLNLGWH